MQNTWIFSSLRNLVNGNNSVFSFLQTLTELDEREKQVRQMETNLQRNEQLLAEQYERKTVEMREASRRLKEEYQHQLHLERIKYTDLEERFRKGEQQLELLEGKVKERENEIYSLKESLLNRPEVKLQSDMSLMLVEKVNVGFIFISRLRNLLFIFEFNVVHKNQLVQYILTLSNVS